jgi:hypothetical protein
VDPVHPPDDGLPGFALSDPNMGTYTEGTDLGQHILPPTITLIVEMDSSLPVLHEPTHR